MNANVIYITAGNKEEALRIGKTLVEERLAACANLFPEIQSVYRWKGKIEEDSESALILKTTEALTESLIKRAKELHSYECPCIIALPISTGNEDFLKWIFSETGEHHPRG